MEIRDQINDLTDEELAEIRSAATWYAKFHARIIAERADDRSAMAVAQRDRYLGLISGLRKLGVRVVDPTAPVTSIAPLASSGDEDQPGRQAA